MRRAAFLIPIAAFVPFDGLEARVSVGNAYSCDVRDAQGDHVANLKITIGRTQDMPDGRLFDAQAMPLWVSSQSDAPNVPEFGMPTTEATLRDGGLRIFATLGPAVGLPPIAPSVAIRIVLDGDEPLNNGYVVIYRQQAGSHFETAGMGPQGIGLCRMVRNGASQ